jgi:hypothetical protein
MPRSKPVQIGQRYWEYQKDALSFYKEILNSYEIGNQLTDEDFDDIFNLLKNHPRAGEKVGCGVSELYIGSDVYAGKCFHIKRTDGSIENFSYDKAVKGDPKPFTIFSKACRKAVESDMISVKESAFDGRDTIKCQETGIYIKMEEAHVDHRQPNTFSVIIDRFIEVNSIDIVNIQYDSIGQYGRQFIDDELANKFREYHKNKATLRIVTKDLNLRRSHMARVSLQKKDLKIQ